jgi:uncharacterized cupin superfamily protein
VGAAPARQIFSDHRGRLFRRRGAAGSERPTLPAFRYSTRAGARALFRAEVHPDSLPWDEWQSPGGKFRGASKELSVALGAKRNTPTGLGGHPFDLELSRLRPGESGCPYHTHAAQWELFLLLEGEAVVRAGPETHRLRAGDVVLHPPGEAHQITNGSATAELRFLLVANNPVLDYWSYPDSKKWGLREPRMFFRPAPADYWDGEE